MLSPKMHLKKGCGDESLYRPGTGRGNNDPLASHDIEDLLNVVDGCEALQQEIEQAEPILKTYIAQQIGYCLSIWILTMRCNLLREAIPTEKQ